MTALALIGCAALIAAGFVIGACWAFYILGGVLLAAGGRDPKTGGRLSALRSLLDLANEKRPAA